MGLKVKDFKHFSKKIVFVESKESKEYIMSLMRNQGVSLLPIIDNDGKDFKGYIKRKDLFFWVLDNPKKSIADLNLEEIIKHGLHSVGEDEYISDVMKKLTDQPAVLIKDERGKYTHIISPRVAANALEKYSAAFREIEKMEDHFRKLITDFGIKIPNPEKTVDELSFFDYIKLVRQNWENLEIADDKKYIIDLMHKCRIYRNQLMHFKVSVDLDRNYLLTSLNDFFDRHFKEHEEQAKAGRVKPIASVELS